MNKGIKSTTTADEAVDPASALFGRWLVSEPEKAHDQTDAAYPHTDDGGKLATFSKPVSAIRAAEFAVEVCEKRMRDGENWVVWVWNPGAIESKQQIAVRVGITWSFVGRPND